MSGKPTPQDRRTAREALALSKGGGATIVLTGGNREKVERALRGEIQMAYERHRRYWRDR
jgi:hypothetical protein